MISKTFLLLLLFTPLIFTQSTTFIPASDSNFRFIGRWDVSNPSNAVADWPGVQVVFSFTNSTTLGLRLKTNGQNSIHVTVSSGGTSTLNTYTLGSSDISVTPRFTASTTYTVTLWKMDDPLTGTITFQGATLDSTANFVKLPARSSKRIEFIGDSITSGAGVLGNDPCNWSPSTDDEYYAYGRLVASSLDAELFVESWGGKGVMRNYNSGNSQTSPVPLPYYYTRTLGGQSSPSWSFSSWVPQAVVINLGTNDYSSGNQPTQQQFVQAYTNFIQTIQKNYASGSPKFFLGCGPMSYSTTCTYVKQVVSNLGLSYLDFTSIDSNYKTGCGGHPNKNGQSLMANITIPVVKSTMGW